jgi:2'-5' RNA ligase
VTYIVTLRLDEESQGFFERQRRQFYPAGLNRIPAHLTLFHRIEASPQVKAVLEETARRLTFQLDVTGLRSLGRGVAYVLASDSVQRVRGDLAEVFAEQLTAQDRQPFAPHVVVQNKVMPAQAKNLLSSLREQFMPFVVSAVGLDLWNYLGGPWALEEDFPFQLVDGTAPDSR